jgi:hypothetical protein
MGAGGAAGPSALSPLPFLRHLDFLLSSTIDHEHHSCLPPCSLAAQGQAPLSLHLKQFYCILHLHRCICICICIRMCMRD